ncbi:MAG: ABC transporter ATP-binding protein [Tannerella sp.]|jgi:iron complex transport system ATP-binding protein|nr:ABC transporter ATP-binding protein [Tannerella sp.]
MKLEIRNATLGYQGRIVLRNVNLKLNTGRTTCIIGSNGAGKTTLFKSMLGILPPLQGEILLDGKNIRAWNRRKFARVVACVPQARALPFPFTAFEVVLFGRTAHLQSFSSPGKKDRLIAEACMERLRIADLRNRIFTRLSGGEQQMVIVARALAQQPAFLMMDEPTSNLDYGNQIKLIRQVNELKNDSLGILMATHSPDHAFMCDADVMVVHDGTVRPQGNCNRIITEAVLKELYGVEVKICSVRDASPDTIRKTCIPMVI